MSETQTATQVTAGMTAINSLSFVIHSAYSDKSAELNKALLKGYFDHRDDLDIKRTHLFNERYENIYLTPEHVPALTQLLDEANAHAGKILGIDNVQSGCWFNDMPPGSITTAHSHDDDDELLSGVYYVDVPGNSGHLIIHHDHRQDIIQPEASLFIFFAPCMVHEVSENLSGKHRISIGINFGNRYNDEY